MLLCTDPGGLGSLCPKGSVVYTELAVSFKQGRLVMTVMIMVTRMMVVVIVVAMLSFTSASKSGK